MAWSDFIPYLHWEEVTVIGIDTKDHKIEFMMTFLGFMMFFFIMAALVEQKKPNYGH